MLGLYTANLAVSLTDPITSQQITSLQSIKDNKNTIYIVKNGFADYIFAQKDIYKSIRPQINYVKTVDEGLQKITASDAVAFIHNSDVLEYVSSRSPCQQLVISDVFESSAYVLIFNQNYFLGINNPIGYYSYLVWYLISRSIVQSSFTGLYSLRYSFWWATQCYTQPILIEGLSYDVLGGAFILILCIYAVSLSFIFVEWIFFFFYKIFPNGLIKKWILKHPNNFLGYSEENKLHNWNFYGISTKEIKVERKVEYEHEEKHVIGTIKYFGPLKNSPNNKNWVGIEWDEDGIGKNDGTAFGINYFASKPNKANFVSLKDFKINFRWPHEEEDEKNNHENLIDIGI